MTTPDNPGINVAAELATLKGALSTELAGLRGELMAELTGIRGDLRAITQTQAATSAEVAKLDQRVTALEARRWPIATVAALSGVISAVAAGLAYLAGQ